MPGWLSDYLNWLGGPLWWFYRWASSEFDEWNNWVNDTLNSMSKYMMRSYILLTYDIANFSYYVGSFSKAVRLWIQWLAYSRIPRFFLRAEKYAFTLVSIERYWRKRTEATLRKELLADIKWVYDTLVEALNDEITARKKAIADLRAELLADIKWVYVTLTKRLNAEIAARKKAILDLRNWTQQQLNQLWAYAKSILPTVDKEASDGYDKTRAAQATGLSKMVDDLAIDNPVVKGIVSDLVKLVIDLAEIDDPVLRIAAQFLLKEIIDRLGVDKLAGDLVNKLLDTFLGGGPPKTLESVTEDIGNRLNATEAQWQQFYSNGGNDIENLGDQMRQSANPLFTAVMAGYFIGAVADPEGTAAATDAVLTPAARAIVTPLIDLFGG